MTGYGKSTFTINNKKITVEIKSLNSKQLDINSRLPGFYKEKEMEIRALLGKVLLRGKIDFSMYAEISGTENVSVVNTDLVKAYYKQLQGIAAELDVDNPAELLSIVMRLPEVLKNEREELNDDEWQVVLQGINNAVEAIIAFRKQEGAALQTEIADRIKLIKNLLLQVDSFELQRIERIKERLRQNLKELAENDNIDENRFEQEMIFYLEKLDITEEKVRLAHHCDYFINTIETSESEGKKLGFITQEIGREINTLGSKANDSDIQKIVIQMKDELEKVKEQLLNIL